MESWISICFWIRAVGSSTHQIQNWTDRLFIKAVWCTSSNFSSSMFKSGEDNKLQANFKAREEDHLQIPTSITFQGSQKSKPTCSLPSSKLTKMKFKIFNLHYRIPSGGGSSWNHDKENNVALDNGYEFFF